MLQPTEVIVSGCLEKWGCYGEVGLLLRSGVAMKKWIVMEK